METTELDHDIPTEPTFLDTLIASENGDRFVKCIQCGWCGGVCPVFSSIIFPPRKLLYTVRCGEFEEALEADSIWMCIACYACTEICPAQIPLSSGLMTRVKEELLLAGNVPTELQDALENTQRYGNPMGESPRKRAHWAQGFDPPIRIMREHKKPVDVLWYVGDFGSYHPRTQQATRALARVLHALGVDFAILGPEESSDGDSQRLAGERGLFEMLAEKNGRALERYSFNEIITADPHAYNALKNEYPALGITHPVRHYTEFLAERIEELKPLLIHEIPALVAFHDPCYLGRVNDIYDDPRAILDAIPGVELVEMSHNRQNSLCCGGGGGGMWLDGFHWEKTQERLTEHRVREALVATPETAYLSVFENNRPKPRRRKDKPQPTQRVLAIACPYEAPRFEDAIKVVREARKLVVRDIAELLAESMFDER